MTDDKLKAAIAKMLPDKLEYYEFEAAKLWDRELHRPTYDSELLHICSLVESGEEMKYRFGDYYDALAEVSGYDCPICATWQQRVAALAKIKNIEI